MMVDRDILKTNYNFIKVADTLIWTDSESRNAKTLEKDNTKHLQEIVS